MDLQNIATHELGHGLGLNDLYESAASEETMYGYSTYGEMSKRSLFIGDIAGIHDLYGV
jgi:predicted Zn-dependent protease